MACFLVDETGELCVNVAIEKFMSVELKDGELIINGLIKIPTDKIMEIKLQRN